MVVDWENINKSDVEDLIEGEEDQPLPCNAENIILVMEKYPDLYADLVAQSNNADVFKREQLEDDAKN